MPWKKDPVAFVFFAIPGFLFVAFAVIALSEPLAFALTGPFVEAESRLVEPCEVVRSRGGNRGASFTWELRFRCEYEHNGSIEACTVYSPGAERIASEQRAKRLAHQINLPAQHTVYINQGLGGQRAYLDTAPQPDLLLGTLLGLTGMHVCGLGLVVVARSQRERRPRLAGIHLLPLILVPALCVLGMVLLSGWLEVTMAPVVLIVVLMAVLSAGSAGWGLYKHIRGRARSY